MLNILSKVESTYRYHFKRRPRHLRLEKCVLIKLPIITSLHMLQNIIEQYQCLSEDMNYVIWKCQKGKLPDFELEELKF